MKKIIIVFFTALVFLNCAKAEDNRKLVCADFKTGKFELINKETHRKYLIERTTDYQIEQTFSVVTNKKIKKDRYYKIFWKDDCEYVLTLDTLKSQPDEIDLYINSTGGYICSIKSIENNCAAIDVKVDNEVLTSKICKID